MTDGIPDGAERAFEANDAFDRVDDERFRLTTTAFDGVVTATEAPEWRTAYVVTVRVPSLDAATVGEVGDAVRQGWFETLELRLEDAPKATRHDVDLESYEVERDGDDVVVTYTFESGDADRAARVAKTFVEYVEGTYAEGVVPGYDYEGPVADLMSNAQSGDAKGSAGGTPL